MFNGLQPRLLILQLKQFLYGELVAVIKLQRQDLQAHKQLVASNNTTGNVLPNVGVLTSY